MGLLKIYKIIFLALVMSTVMSCNKEDSTISKEALNVNEFVLDYMDYFYLWTAEVSTNLDPKGTRDSKDFFDKVVYKGTSATYDSDLDANRDGDRWSFITDDLQGLLDYFNGVRTSAGYYSYAYRIGETGNLALVVAYVYENTPASEANFKRGTVILKVDGQDLTDENINTLLSQESYVATMGEYDFGNKEFVSLNKTSEIIKREIHTNPIIKSEIYNIDGVKIAYLLYNSFIHNYDDELIVEFQKYKDAGVTELVLDFRYNGGGAVSSALNISSMIAPQSAIGEVFLKKKYNDKLQDTYLNDSRYGKGYLEDKLSSVAYGFEDDGGIKGTVLPNLDLNRVYVIGLEGTASASELVINGLEPYMPGRVITVGGRTHGKYTASTTFKNKDYPNWAIQPIIFKSANANDVSDYWNGFEAKLSVDDQPIYGDFGYDVDLRVGEKMLTEAINDITDRAAKKESFEEVTYDVVKMPVSNSRLSTTMIYDVK